MVPPQAISACPKTGAPRKVHYRGHFDSGTSLVLGFDVARYDAEGNVIEEGGMGMVPYSIQLTADNSVPVNPETGVFAPPPHWQLDEEGNQVLDEEGNPIWVVPESEPQYDWIVRNTLEFVPLVPIVQGHIAIADALKRFDKKTP